MWQQTKKTFKIHAFKLRLHLQECYEFELEKIHTSSILINISIFDI